MVLTTDFQDTITALELLLREQLMDNQNTETAQRRNPQVVVRRHTGLQAGFPVGAVERTHGEGFFEHSS